MRQWFIATAALLSTAVSYSHADYVIIRVYSKSPGGQGVGVLGIGGQPPMGNIGFGGQPPMGAIGAIGQPPMGAIGIGIQPPMGAIGVAGQPPMGAIGVGGGQLGQRGVGGGQLGQFGNLAGGGQPAMGAIGAIGQPPMGAIGVGGGQFGQRGAIGQPPMGAIGAAGQPPMGAIGVGGGQFGQRGAIGQPPMGAIGAIGQPPMGAIGAIGQPPMGAIGAIGQPPMGAIGAIGQPPMGAIGAIGQPPMGAIGAIGQPPMGAIGAIGQPPMGAIGVGIQPPMGAIGGPPQGNFGGGAPQSSVNDYVTVVIEVKKSPTAKTGFRPLSVKPLTDPVLFMDSNFGSTALYDSDPNEIALQLIPSEHAKGMNPASGPTLKSPKEQYADRRKTLLAGKDRGPDRYYDEALWCLQVGMPDKCIDYMNELEKMLTMSKDKVALTKRVNDALEAYRKVKPIIDDEVVKKDKATNWKERLGYKSMAQHKHYALVHNSEVPERDGIDRRLEALENNFKTFYLLFALKGKVMPAPTQKLVAVVVAEPSTFAKQRQIFNVEDLVSDGFHARQENLAIFSPNRTDLASHTFYKTMQEVHREYEVDLLNGKMPDLGSKDQAPRAVTQVKRAQTLALVERALREESEIAAATHEGTLQLVAETGLLPRNAPAPEWLRFGLASLFEMPKGPFPGNNQSIARMAFWPGAGGPNWAWRLYFDEMQQEGLIPERPGDLFYDVLTDAWFNRARDLERNKTEGVDISHDKGVCLARARTLSWALTYYLFDQRFAEFEKFLAELSNLPRDAELDHYTLVTAFLKNFGYDATGLTPADPKGKQPDRYFGVARSWVASIRNAPVPLIPLRLEAPAPPSGPNPGGPIGPGLGIPGAIGPGFPGKGPNGGN